MYTKENKSNAAESPIPCRVNQVPKEHNFCTHEFVFKSSTYTDVFSIKYNTVLIKSFKASLLSVKKTFLFDKTSKLFTQKGFHINMLKCRLELFVCYKYLSIIVDITT